MGNESVHYAVHQATLLGGEQPRGQDYSEILGRILRVERDMRLAMVDLTSTTASGIDNLRIPQSPRNRQMHKITVDSFPNWEDFTARKKGTPEGLVLIVPFLNQLPEEQTESVRAYIGRNLFHGAESFRRKVWVICRDPEAKPQEMRTFAENFGLVEINDGKDDISHTAWVSGRPKKKGEHAPVDLTQKDYFDGMRRRVIGEYESQGFTVVSRTEAMARCRASKMPKDDLDKMKSGFGVFVEGNCGCVIKIDFRGDQYQLSHCEGDNCACEKKAPETQGQIELDKWTVYPGHDCFDCGKVLEREAIGLVGGPQLHEGTVMQKVHFQVRCSNNKCGKSHDEPQEVFKFVDPQRIVHPQRRGK